VPTGGGGTLETSKAAGDVGPQNIQNNNCQQLHNLMQQQQIGGAGGAVVTLGQTH
jgi:hypothetical protein